MTASGRLAYRLCTKEAAGAPHGPGLDRAVQRADLNGNVQASGTTHGAENVIVSFIN